MPSILETAERRFTVEEWLEWEKNSDIRHEYHHGNLIPMAGEAKKANKITKNLIKLLDDHLYKKGIEVFSHDVKAEVAPGKIYRYPDLVAAPVADDGDDYIVKMPVLIVEVASENSRNRDQVKKRREYFEIPSLWYYLIISQDEMWAELHSKNEQGRWETRFFTEPDDRIELERFDRTILLKDVYERVEGGNK